MRRVIFVVVFLLLLVLFAPSTGKTEEGWDAFYALIWEGYHTYVVVLNTSDDFVNPMFKVKMDGKEYKHYRDLWTEPYTVGVHDFN